MMMVRFRKLELPITRRSCLAGCLLAIVASVGCARSSLPMLDLRVASEIPSGAKIACQVKMTHPSGRPEENTEWLEGQIRIRGASSQFYDKKSFQVKLEKPHEWLGLAKNRDWVLNAAFVDCSMMRHKLCYDLYRSMAKGSEKRFASSSRFIEVRLNDSYHGAYLLMERIERSLLGLQPFDKEKDQHAVIYKAIDHGADFQQQGHRAYEQHEPEVELLPYWGPIEELNRFVSRATEQEFLDEQSGIEAYFDTSCAVDFHLLLLFTSNMDGYDKNFIIARDAPSETQPRPKFFFVPWDYDATLGRNWEGSNVEPYEWLSNHLFDRLLSYERYKQRYRARWQELRRGPFAVDQVVRMIDENVRVFGPAAARNERRWKGDFSRDPTQLTFVEDVKQMKKWIERRVQWLDEEILRRTGP